LGGDSIAVPRFRCPDENCVILLVEGPDVNDDDPLGGTAPHDPMRSVDLLDRRSDVQTPRSANCFAC
jgi:hypothetical protein